MSIEKRRKARVGSSLNLRRLARAVSRALGRKSIGRPHHRFEALEERRLMATTPIINEFMASNNTGHQDPTYPAERPDWVELYNPTASAIDLGSGWKLKDDSNIWSFPAGASLPANGYMVIFADSKNLTSASGRYHTNFNLAKDGEYLALVNPSNDVVHEYIPGYPAQETDISYGTAQQQISHPLVTPQSSIKGFVPVNNSLGNTWWNANGFDETGWSSNVGGAGYETESSPPAAPAGFNMKMIDTSAGDIANVAVAKQLLDNNGTLGGFTVASNITQPRTRIDALEGGRFNNNDSLPNGASSATANTAPSRTQYALRITSHVTIPAGTYTIGVNSDDGFQLTIPGVTFFNRLNENYNFTSSAANQLTFSAPRGASDTLGTFSIPSGGLQTTIQLDVFEQTGGDSAELFIASGQRAGFDPGVFTLLQDTTLGWAVKQSASDPTYNGLFGLNMLTPMRNVNASAYLRVPFTVEQAGDFSNLKLKMRYDDGFVAYINGQEVARRNAPGAVGTPPGFSAAATGAHADTLAVIDEEFVINVTPGMLQNGANMLAIHALNQTAGDVDFLMVPQLEGLTPTVEVARFFGAPTPGAVNSTAYQGKVADTKFSHDRGFYSAPFQLTITTAENGAQIRYTLDGTPPTSSTGTVYNGPITINKTMTLRAAAFKAGFLQTNVDTQTYIFVDDVVTQSLNGQAPAGWPTSWGSNVVDYGMDPEIVNNPQYSATIKNDLKTIPSLSIVTELKHLFDPSTGIIANPSGEGIAWERPASLELINPDGSEGFQINAGLRLRGGYSRSTNNPKHAFRVLFRPEYGDDQLEYDLFKSMDGTEVLDGFDMRTMQNYSWSFDPGGGGNMIAVRDMFSRDTQHAMGHNSERGDYYHMYVNGQYWGMFNTAERPEASYGATYYGGSPEDYDVIKVEAGPYSINATDGNMTAWTDFHNQARTIGGLADGNAQIPVLYNKLLGLNADGTRNPAYPVYLDADNLIDYMMTIVYGGNRDAPISAFIGDSRPNNFYALRNRNDPDMGWQYFSHDAEHTLLVGDLTLNRLGPFTSTDFQSISYSNPQSIWQWLWKSNDFKMEIADHLHKHYFNGGALTPGAVSSRLIARRDEINRAIVGESARWGDSKSGSPYTYQTWVNNFNNVLQNYVPQRSSIVLGQFLSAGLYPTLDAPELNKFGGVINAGFNMTLSNPDGVGTVYYTLDGSDPRLPGGALNPNALVYSGAVTLNDSALLFARIRNGATWSASTEALFENSVVPKLRVSEIMYHPADPAADSPYGASDFEYIELQNIGNTPLDISKFGFDRGLTLTFTAGTILQPGERKVIVNNLAAFQTRYPGITPIGEFEGDLANGGERIRLVGQFGQIIQNFTFNDGWYDHTDGEGFSLVVTDTNQTLTLFDAKEGWRASANLSGDPGSFVASLNPKSIAINEVLANPAAPNQTWIELKNTTASAINISGWFLSNDDVDLKKYKFPAGTIIQPGAFLLLGEQTSYGQTGGAGVNTVFSLTGTGGTVYLSSADGTEALLGYREEQDYGAAFTGQSVGRYIKTNGAQDFAIQASATPGTENGDPTVGPIVINELNYSPTGIGQEFIELRNTTDQPVDLFDPLNPTNTWRFGSGVNFAFPQGASIAAFGYALVVGIDPAAFRTQYNIPQSVPIFGPYTGFLENQGENLALQRPGAPDGLGVVPYINVDRVNYDSTPPWPSSPDGTGPTLIRNNPQEYGNDPVYWSASTQQGGSPGFSNLPSIPPQITMAATSSSTEGATWQLSGSFIDLDAGQSFTAEVNWGDSVTIFPLTLNPNGTFNLSHLFTDSGSFNVRVRVSDSGNAFADAFCLVTVANVAPTANFVLTGGTTMTEGATKSVNFSNPFDPSSTDTNAGFRYSYDWDNDGTYDLINSPLSSRSIPTQYIADGPVTRTIKGKIDDKNGGFTEYTVTLTVNNLVPIIEAIDDAVLPGPGNYLGFGSFIDANADLSTLVGSVDWNYHPGDTDSEPLVLDTVDLFFELNHTFSTPGVYKVRVRIADDDGAVGVRDFQVSVGGDTTPPSVTGANFVFETAPRKLKAQFSEDVYNSLASDPTAISIMNLTTGVPVAASAYTLSYDFVTNWATWTFNGDVANGNYKLTLVGAKVKDSSGNMLDGDANGSAGGDHEFPFWYLAADTNRDRQVTFADLLAVSAGFGTGTTLAQGDVTGDGAVTFADLILVAAKFGSTLPAPAPAAPVPAAATLPSTSSQSAATPTTTVAAKLAANAAVQKTPAIKPKAAANAPVSAFSSTKIAKKRNAVLD